MPRPTTKPGLTALAEGQFEKLWKLIGAIPEEKQNAAFDFGDPSGKKEAHWARDKNLRDVLAHLYEWHRLLLGWVPANQRGESRPFLPAPYNWRTYGGMNVELWEKHQATPYDEVKSLLAESHRAVMALIQAVPEDLLFTKGSLPWTGGATLASYCVSVTSSHYDWAMKKVKLHAKTVCGG